MRVSRLFYNAPARLKFLRGARSEWRAILDVVGDDGAHAARRARCRSRTTAKPMLDAARRRDAARSARRRVYGGAFAGRLLDGRRRRAARRTSRGLVERPADVGTATRRVFLSVNGRAIRDTGIVRAAEAAYRSTIPAGVRPTLFLDVVVAADIGRRQRASGEGRSSLSRSMAGRARRRDAPCVARSARSTRARCSVARRGRSCRAGAGPAPIAASMSKRCSRAPATPDDGLFEPDDSRRSRPMLAPKARASDAHRRAPATADVPPLVQLQRTYMMFEHDHGVVLIDQHSAHERVLYEQFMRTLERGRAPAQRLLFPMTLHLGPAESEAFERNRELFERLGFEIEGFGGHTLIVRAVPMPHPRFDAERCLRETLAALTGDRDAGSARAPRASRRDRRLQGGDQGGRRAVAGGDARAVHRAARHDAAGARRARPRRRSCSSTWDEIERRFGRR